MEDEIRQGQKTWRLHLDFQSISLSKILSNKKEKDEEKEEGKKKKKRWRQEWELMKYTKNIFPQFI